MRELAKLTIAEMSDEVKAAFLVADLETREKLALIFMEEAADKQQKITNLLRSCPVKMDAMKSAVYDMVTA